MELVKEAVAGGEDSHGAQATRHLHLHGPQRLLQKGIVGPAIDNHRLGGGGRVAAVMPPCYPIKSRYRATVATPSALVTLPTRDLDRVGGIKLSSSRANWGVGMRLPLAGLGPYRALGPTT